MAAWRFPFSRRLHHSREFDAVFHQQDTKVATAEFLFLAKKNDRGFHRLGMIVSKKNIPTSVGRNRIKRQIRERFRQTKCHDVGMDILVLCRPGVRMLDRGQLRETLALSFDRLLADIGRDNE